MTYKKYILNPCPYLHKKNGIKERKQNSDECYRTCARLIGGDGNIDNSNLELSNCGKRCWSCANLNTIAVGKNPCEFRQVMPPLWLERGYYRKCLDQVGDKDKALSMCLSNCDTETCKENCVTDYNSVYEYFTKRGDKYQFWVKLILTSVAVLYFVKLIMSSK